MLTGALLARAAPPANEELALPKHANREPMDFEPKLMLENVPGSPLPDVSPAPADVQKLADSLERAKKAAAAYAGYLKEGIVAKVEAEERELRVVRITKELEAARSLAAKADAEAQRKRFANHEIPKEEADKAEAALVTATATANEAAAAWDRAEMDAALLNLKRARQLLASGVATKRDVQRAEDRVAAIGATPTPRESGTLSPMK